MLYLLLLYDLNMILLCVQTTIGNAGKTYAGRSEKGLPAAAACRPQHIYMVIELQHLRFVISCCPLCLRSQRRSTSLLSSFRPLSAVFGTSLLAVCNACCIQCAADDVISGTGQIAGDVGCNFDSIGKTYSGDLTKCRIRLLRCSRLDCCADTALLRSTDSDGTLAQGVEASLQCRRCGLLDRCLTTLSNELVILVRFCAAQGYAAVSFPMRFSLQNLPDTRSFFRKKSAWKRCGRSHTHELYASVHCLSIKIFILP